MKLRDGVLGSIRPIEAIIYQSISSVSMLPKKTKTKKPHDRIRNEIVYSEFDEIL